MRHDHETIKIAVLENSAILRYGIMTTLSRSLDCGIQFYEIPNITNIASAHDFEPDIVIVDPNIIGQNNLKHFKTKISEKALYVALVHGAADNNIISGYNASINLYDTPDDIHALIDNIMGYSHKEECEELSEREKEIIKGVVRGLPNKIIADELNLSVHTIISHRRNIAKKLQIHSASALTIYAITNNLVNLNEERKLI